MRKLFESREDYLEKREAMFVEAEKLINEGDMEGNEAKMQEIKDFDDKYEKFALAQANMNALRDKAPTENLIINGDNALPGKDDEIKQLASERGRELKKNNVVTVSSGTIVTPAHTADDIRPTFNEVSGLIDRVTHKMLVGGESFKQPYVKGYGEGNYSTEGTDYNDAEVEFDYAEINKSKITAYAEDTEELKKLPDADYDFEVQNGVRIASRKTITRQILIGGGATNQLVGIFSANASAINAATDIEFAAIDNATLDDIIFSFGGDEDVEDAAVLVLNKKDLKAFSQLRTNDGKKFHDIKTNGNTGTIDGIPFIINSACKAVSDAATQVGDYAMAYGPLSNYMLTIFSETEIKRSEDYKFKQGIIAHKASTFLGGNVVSANGFLRIKKATAV